MPLQRCEQDGRPGWKWGATGACFTYAPGSLSAENIARKNAMAQAVAISFAQKRAGKTPDIPHI
jgi:hypothetical protein